MNFLRSSLWSILGGVGQNLINIFFFFVLVRHVQPGDMGAVAASLIAIEMCIILSRVGISELTVRHRSMEPAGERMLFLIVLTWAGFLSLCLMTASIILLSSGKILYGEALAIGAAGPFIYALSGPAEGSLAKSSQFKLLSFRQFSGAVAGCFAGLVWLYTVGDAVALAVFRLAQITAATLAVLLSSGWRLPRQKSAVSVRGYLLEGAAISGTSLIQNANQRIIDIVIGTYLTAASLGIWRFSFRAADSTIQFVLTPLSAVAYSRFTKEAGKSAVVVYYRLIRIGCIGMSIAFVTVGLEANYVVELLAGKAWVESIPLIEILSFLGISAVLNVITPPLIVSAGAASKMFVLNIYQLCVSVIIALIFVQYGLTSAVIGHVLRAYLYSFLLLYISHRTAELRFKELIAAILPALICSLAGSGFIIAIRPVLPAMSSIGNFALESAIAIIFMIFVTLLMPSVRADVKYMWKQVRQPVTG